MPTKEEIYAMSKEFQKGYTVGKLDSIDIYREKGTLQYRTGIKYNMRLAIRGCQDDYIMVKAYWQGYLLGYIQTGSKLK